MSGDGAGGSDAPSSSSDDTKFGEILFQFLGATVMGDSTVKSDSNYYIKCDFRTGTKVLRGDKATLESFNRKHKGNNLGGLSATARVPCRGIISNGDAFDIHLFESNFFGQDELIASGSVKLDALARPAPDKSNPAPAEGESHRVTATLQKIEVDPNKKKDSGKAAPKLGVAFIRVNVQMEWSIIPNYLKHGGVGQYDGSMLAAGGDGSVDLPKCVGRGYSVRIKIHKARNLQSKKDDGLYNPMVAASVLGETQKTEHIDGDMNPHFDEELVFEYRSVKEDFFTSPIVLHVLSHGIVMNDTVGTVQIDCGTVYASNKDHFMQNRWMVLRKGGLSSTVMGFIKVSIAVLDLQRDVIPEAEEDEHDGDENEEALVMALVSAPGAKFEEIYVRCEVFKGSGIPAMDIAVGDIANAISQFFTKRDVATGGSTDPFVKFSSGAKSVKTPPRENTFDPEWNTFVVMPVQLPTLCSKILISLWDDDVTGNERIATHGIDINELQKSAASAETDHDIMSLPAQYINFYGSMRSKEGHSDYQSKMDKNLVPGVDFRGRVLLRLHGNNAVPGECDPGPVYPTEGMVKLHLKLSPNLFSLLPSRAFSDDNWVVVVSVGTTAVSSESKKGARMSGVASHMSAVDFSGTAPVSLETDVLVALPANSQGDIFSGCDALAFILQQIPDTIVHIRGSNGSAVAALRVKTADLLNPQTTPTGEVYVNDTMMTMVDPLHVSEGEQVCRPLAQLSCRGRMELVGADGFAETVPEVVTQAVKPRLEQHKAALAKLPPQVSAAAGQREKWVLECCVHHARQVPAGDSDGLSDPFIRVSWGSGSGETGYKLKTRNPMFGEMIRYVVDLQAGSPPPNFVFEAWDWDLIGSNTFLGSAVLPIDPKRHILTDDRRKQLGALSSGARTDEMWEFVGNFESSRMLPVDECAVLVSIMVYREADAAKLRVPAPQKTVFTRAPREKATYKGLAIPEDRRIPTSLQQVSVSCLGLRRLRRFRMSEIKKPVVEFDLAGHVVRLKKPTSATGPSADFSRSFEVLLELPTLKKFVPQMVVRIYDDRFASTPLVGSALVDITIDAFTPKEKERRVALQNQKVDQTAEKLLQAKKDVYGTGLPPTEERLVLPTGAQRPWGSNQEGGVPVRSTSTLGGGSAGSGSRKAGLVARRSASGALSEEGAIHGEDVELLEETHQTAADTLSAAMHETSRAFFEAEANAYWEGGDAQSGAAAHDPLNPDKFCPEECGKLSWFDRFDPPDSNEVDAEDVVMPQYIVSRFGKLGKKLRREPGQSTLEDMFGPFGGDHQLLDLHRGWGKHKKKAGMFLFDLVYDAAIASKPSAQPLVPTGDTEIITRPLLSREPARYKARVYIVGCTNLAPKDQSIFGNKSDPYCVITMQHNSGKTRHRKKFVCSEERKYQTLDPEFFLMREVDGSLPENDIIRIEVFDYDKIGSDELIGFTEINIEERWYGERGFGKPAVTGKLFPPGSYTEKRMLRNEVGQVQGDIEMWVDLFEVPRKDGDGGSGAGDDDASSGRRPSAVAESLEQGRGLGKKKELLPVPPPFKISPPLPIELELRVIVWNARDVVFQETSLHGEEMTDIYIRCWLNGMKHEMQQTDVHYRSLDGNGNFNWRMVFPFVFEPRSKKMMAPNHAESTVASFFSIRKEAKKFDPYMKIQIWDDDILPGTDDFIGELDLNMLKMRPTLTSRKKDHLLGLIIDDLVSLPCCKCCQRKKKISDLTLKEMQKAAYDEYIADLADQEEIWDKEAQAKVDVLMEQKDEKTQLPIYTPAQLTEFKKSFLAAARRKSVINIFDQLLHPSKDAQPVKKHEKAVKGGLSVAEADPASPAPHTAESTGSPKAGNAAEGDYGGQVLKLPKSEEDELPEVYETPRYWFTCRGPKGAGRMGDVQLSFEVVRTKAMKDDKSLVAGRGRGEPHALPDPKRPETSFFWLTSPWKAAVHILWKNYKWHLLGAIVVLSIALYIYQFGHEGIIVGARKFFKDEEKAPSPATAEVAVHTTVVVPTPQP